MQQHIDMFFFVAQKVIVLVIFLALRMCQFRDCYSFFNIFLVLAQQLSIWSVIGISALLPVVVLKGFNGGLNQTKKRFSGFE
jgi:hypothetical protein